MLDDRPDDLLTLLGHGLVSLASLTVLEADRDVVKARSGAL
jgi:hypothetical protein